jgi:poly(A) polymerase
MFEELRYPGIDLADAALDKGEHTFYFKCVDLHSNVSLFADPFKQGEGRRPSFKILEFYQNIQTGHFIDPKENYSLLQNIKKGLQPNLCSKDINEGIEQYRALMDWALILPKYFPLEKKQYNNIEIFKNLKSGTKPCIEEQKLLLVGLLSSANPALGLDFLMQAGFIQEFWPELAVLNKVEHSKDYHPEGNVWKHTLETFRHRKPTGGIYDLRLSLALLLHDVGKPIAETSGSKRFDGHAEMGEVVAGRFLRRLKFPHSLISDICYLVKNHMFPAALPRLPLARSEERMASPLFPLLMELYRCDESSSFKGLDGYYESAAAYQAFLRYRKNPYRTPDGKLKRK